jgi:hypothetical protein
MRSGPNQRLLSPGNYARFWPFLAKLTRVHSQNGARGITGAWLGGLYDKREF